MAESSTQSIMVDAPVVHVAAVICDFGRYPQWANAVRETEILARYDDGSAQRVRFVLDAGPVRDEYVLAYEYAQDFSRIQWRLTAPSTMQKAQTGCYVIEDNGDGTCRVTYTLEVELSIPMIGMFRRKAEKMIMDTALKELKRRVESQTEPREGGDEPHR